LARFDSCPELGHGDLPTLTSLADAQALRGAVGCVKRVVSSGVTRTQSGHTPGFCSLYKSPLRIQCKMVPGEVWNWRAARRTETRPW
jgi:hypothetical protein